MTTLFVANAYAHSVGGREQLSALHETGLRELLGDRLEVMRLTKNGASLSAFLGRIDGATVEAEQRLVERLRRGDVETVWFDGSNLGRLVRAAAKAAPPVRRIVFAHNVESAFFLGALRRRPRPRALAVLVANVVAEAMAVRHASTLVALNDRDGLAFARRFGRGADALLPMALHDRFDGPGNTTPGAPLLFVGGGFYANRAGIRWYADAVAPIAARETKVVGRGLEDERASLSGKGMRFIGEVDALADVYQRCAAAVAPIFDGSGMKTKVAEALMHGRRVIGSSEAFVGYDPALFDLGCARCDSADDYRRAIAALPEDARFVPALRAHYEAHHSPAALRERMANILS